MARVRIIDEGREGFIIRNIRTRDILDTFTSATEAEQAAHDLGHTVLPSFYGYHEEHTLPFKQRQKVIIPRGVKIYSFNPRHRGAFYHCGKTYIITIHHLMPGRSELQDDNKTWVHYENQKVCWPGTGYYWCETEINNVLPA
jgi:hypothetical protein